MNAVVEIYKPSKTQFAVGESEHAIIVGNGPAGIHMAKELVKNGYPGKISIFGEEAWEPYDRVKLSSLLNGDIKLNDVSNMPTELASEKIFQHFNCRISSIDPDQQIVCDEQGRKFHYDKLIVATGSKPHVPNIEGSELKGVYCFRNLTDVQHLMARSLKSRRTVVIGGGLLGLEAARAMQRGGTEVVLIQHGSRVMNRQLDDEGAELLHRHIKKLNIKLMLNTHVTRIRGDESVADKIVELQSGESGANYRKSVSSITLSSGETIECDTVIFATGIAPNVELSQQAGIAIGRGFKVNEQLKTNVKNIHAIGECAEYQGQVWGLVAPGLQQAACLAKIIAGKPDAYMGSISTARLKVLGIDVFSMGMVGDEHEKQIDKSVVYRQGDIYRKLFLKRGRLVGAIIVGESNQSVDIQKAIEDNATILPWQLWRFKRRGELWGGNVTSVDRWADTATVCQCNGVSVADVKAALASDGMDTLAALQQQTAAGTTCGSCVPLLQSFVGQPVSAKPQKVGGFWAATGIVILLIAALLSIDPLPYARSIADSHWWEFFLRDSQVRQFTGFTLLGIAAISMLVSARKRIKKFKAGNFNLWRVIHAFLGGTCIALLYLHTGFDLGSNINGLLMTNFILLAVLGVVTTLVLSLMNRVPIQANNQLRKYSTWGHILLFWPLPALLGMHILSVYFF